ncbi:hypothetical protein [Paenibacillus sp. 453mf]|uniref:hypothetical protein n=1 Tax=Paenibacillus sp. 453mf TaxID=1761874 RepID=UPI00147F61F2|nr:hypothetical protein [Paenibacillus sp. 453mf]
MKKPDTLGVMVMLRSIELVGWLMVAACAKVSSIVLVREWHRIEEVTRKPFPYKYER